MLRFAPCHVYNYDTALRDTLHCDEQPSVVACGTSLTSMTGAVDLLTESHLTDMPDKSRSPRYRGIGTDACVTAELPYLYSSLSIESNRNLLQKA